jgi:hypothetical protein
VPRARRLWAQSMAPSVLFYCSCISSPCHSTHHPAVDLNQDNHLRRDGKQQAAISRSLLEPFTSVEFSLAIPPTTTWSRPHPPGPARSNNILPPFPLPCPAHGRRTSTFLFPTFLAIPPPFPVPSHLYRANEPPAISGMPPAPT